MKNTESHITHLKNHTHQKNQMNQGDALGLPKGWEIKKLGDVCRFINGRAYSQQELLKEGKYPVLRVGNFYTNRDWYYSDLELPEDKYCDKGDLLYAWSASFGPRIWDGEKVIYHYHIWKVEPNESLIRKDFLFQLLEWDTEALKTAHGTGTTMMHVGKGSIEKRLIPLPPLPEQQRIVSILDKAFAAIAKAKANAEQNLKNAKELFESYLQGIMSEPRLTRLNDSQDFENQGNQKNQINQGDALSLPKGSDKGEGWEVRKLGEVIEYDKNQNIHKGLPYVGLEHIESNSGRFIGSLESQVVKSSTFYFNEQHVLYGRLRPYLNKVLLPDIEGHCSTEIFPIKVGKQIAREFLFYWLIAGSTVKKIDATWTGARMPRANMNQVLEFDFAFPPLKEQQTIVRQLDALRAETQKLEAVYQKKIDDLEELKKSILQLALSPVEGKAFAGELKVSEPLINAD